MKRTLVALFLVFTMLSTLGMMVSAETTANSANGRYAGTYLDIDFDSTADVKTTVAPTDSSMAIKDGVLKVSTSLTSVAANQAFDFELNVPETTIDMSKPFTYSFRLRMSGAAAGFAQFVTDLADNSKLAQISTDGKFGVAQFAAASVNTNANTVASETGLTNLKDGNWHTIDILLTPVENGNGKCEFVAYIDNVEIYDSTGAENQNTALEDKFYTHTFTDNTISSFILKLWLMSSFTSEEAWTLEMDYFRVGDGTLNSDNTDNNGNTNPSTADITLSTAIVSVVIVISTAVISKKHAK